MRSLFDVRESGPCAFLAAAMAARPSSSSANRTWPMTSSSDGLNRSKSSVPWGTSSFPPM
jgi:hypothetical protein